MTRAPATRRALAAASDVRAALRDCRAALAADPSPRRARLRAGTCLMRLGAFEDAHAEFLIAAEGDAGGTAATGAAACRGRRARRRLVDSLTRVDGGALASLAAALHRGRVRRRARASRRACSAPRREAADWTVPSGTTTKTKTRWKDSAEKTRPGVLRKERRGDDGARRLAFGPGRLRRGAALRRRGRGEGSRAALGGALRGRRRRGGRRGPRRRGAPPRGRVARRVPRGRATARVRARDGRGEVARARARGGALATGDLPARRRRWRRAAETGLKTGLERSLLEVMTTTKPVRNLLFRNVRTRPS